MIIKFYTEGCQPCKAVSSVLNSNEIDYDEIDIGKSISKTQEWINDNCS
jgi:glutaredoxin